jgi:SAM-dependent methyltransferase
MLAGASLWRRHPLPPPRHSHTELLARVEELNAAAERQWRLMSADPERRGYLLEKPFAGLREAPAMLYRLGLALEALDLGLGHTVLDFGAGSCWLSIILNRLRCRTISLDVSPTALALGREALALEPHAHPELDPQFLPYDGRKIPLPDAAVDRVLCFDSFHHVPNQDEILAELVRVLRPGGRAVLAEPGEGHSHADASEFDARTFGVLENDLVLDDLLERVRRAGFSDVQVKPYPDAPILLLSAAAHLRLLAGDHSLFPMNHMIDSLKQFHLLILFKGQPTRDSRNPNVLRAKISVPEGTRLAGGAGTLAGFTMQVENTGDTTWLAAEDRLTGGYVGLGGHLLDAAGRTIRIGFLTERLPRDVAPGESVEVRSSFGLPGQAGRFVLRLDLVADGIAWFSQKGSPTTDVPLDVAWSESRDPHRLAARIEPSGSLPPRADAQVFRLQLRLTNTGDTIWLAEPAQARGTVSVGVQLVDETGAPVDRDYLRIPLPGDVAPGEAVEIDAVVPRPPDHGRFAVDLVAEQICWFVSHGSQPLVFTLE